MGEFEVEGPRATALLQSTLSNDLDRIAPGQAQYTLLTNERGGIIDDLIIYRLSGLRYLLIVNAANRETDFRWLKEREIPGSDVRDVSDEYALLAIQGPRAIERLGLPEAAQFTFAEGEIDGIQCMVNRTGYTGEQGCEVLVTSDDAADLWDRVLERGAVPCGLGARDTLRLEASLPLHGNDITPETDAISAGLAWCCALDKEFSGATELRELTANGPERKLVSFVMAEKSVPRQGMTIEGGGDVTSGTHSPMLDRGIGMGYVVADAAAPDTELAIDVRGKSRRARVVKRPIYKREE
jgi:aminomethyltransferase